MAVFSGPEIANNGLILNLDARNVRSYPGTGSSWTNLGSSQNVLTVGAGITHSNGAFVYNGTANQTTSFTFNSTQFINTNYTWIAWVLGTQTVNNNMPSIGYGSGGWARLGFRSDVNWTFSAYNDSGPPNTSDVLIGAGSTTAWTNLCAVGDFSNSVIRTYRNGIFSSQGTYRNTTGNGSSFGIGISGDTFTGWNSTFTGQISIVQIYNRVLTETEIKQNFEATRGRYGI